MMDSDNDVRPNRELLASTRKCGRWSRVSTIGAIRLFALACAGCESFTDAFDRNDAFWRRVDSAPPPNPDPRDVRSVIELVTVPTMINGNVETPGLLRQADCSLTSFGVDMNLVAQSTTPNFQNQLHAASGLQTVPNVYPKGCGGDGRGTAAQLGVIVGRLAGGGYYGASHVPDETKISIIITDSVPVLQVRTDVQIAASGSNSSVLALLGTDLNGDGNPDLAVLVGGGSDHHIAVLLGNGLGVFAAPVSYPVPANVSGVTDDDFNGDGRLDLAISGFGVNPNDPVGDYTAVLLGNGDGTFAAATMVATGAGGSAVVSADFNGDNRKDLVTADAHVLIGRGDGSFIAPTGAAFEGGGGLASGDFDGDGALDLAVAAPGPLRSPVITLWRGGGNGSFTRLTPSYATSYLPDAVVSVGDIDGDGNLDVVAGIGVDRFGFAAGFSNNGTVTYLLGRGDGSFASVPAYANATSLVADFNRDGRPDLFAYSGDAASEGARPLLGNGTSFSAAALTPLGFNFLINGPVAYVAPDLDGDGAPDLVAMTSSNTGAFSSTIHSRLGNGDGSFRATGGDAVVPIASSALNPGAAPLLASADFNGDDRRDMVVIGGTTASSPSAPATGGLFLLTGNGDGTFQAPQPIDASLVNPSAVAVADLNGDGLADIVVADFGAFFGASGFAPGGLRVYLGNSSGSFQTALAVGAARRVRSLAVGDVNGDGRPDLVDVVFDNATFNDSLEVFLGNGTGGFAAPIVKPLTESASGIAIGDLDGDGKADLIDSSCCGLAFTTFLKGNGDGSFANEQRSALGISSQLPALADFNGDGGLDLVLSQDTYAEVFITRTGSGAADATVALAANPTTITLGASTTLTWSSTNATACTASGAWSGAEATSGTQTVTPTATGTASYTLTCSGNGASANSTATVTVNAVPPPTTPGPAPSAGGGGGGGAFGWLGLLLGLPLAALRHGTRRGAKKRACGTRSA